MTLGGGLLWGSAAPDPEMARTFTEAEARKVFARVAEKQRAAGLPAGGLSLEDLEEAARAAGLDASLVATAAAEIDTPAATLTLLGAPAETVGQRVVRGRVSDEAWEEMVAAARVEFGRTGTAGQLGRTREWSFTGMGNQMQATTRVALEPAGADTRIVVTRSSRDAALGFTIGGGIQAVMAVIFSALFAFGADPELWIPALILASMSVVMLGGSQIGLRAWHRAQERRVGALLDRFELAAGASAAPERAAPERAAPAGRVDARLFDDAPDAVSDDSPGVRADRRTHA